MLITSAPMVSFFGTELGVTVYANDKIVYELLGDAKVLSDDSYNLGGQGEHLGFVQDNALGVEFDSYYHNTNDPSYKHIAILKDNVRTHLANVKDDRVDDSTWHDVVVSISNNIAVVLDGKEVLSYKKVDFLEDEIYVGIAAATGSSKNRHLVKDIIVENSDREIPTNVSFEKHYNGK